MTAPSATTAKITQRCRPRSTACIGMLKRLRPTTPEVARVVLAEQVVPAVRAAAQAARVAALALPHPLATATPWALWRATTLSFRKPTAPTAPAPILHRNSRETGKSGSGWLRLGGERI